MDVSMGVDNNSTVLKVKKRATSPGGRAHCGSPGLVRWHKPSRYGGRARASCTDRAGSGGGDRGVDRGGRRGAGGRGM